MLKTVGYLLTKDTDHCHQNIIPRWRMAFFNWSPQDNHTKGHHQTSRDWFLQLVPMLNPGVAMFQPLHAAECSTLATWRDWESSCLLTVIRWGDTSVQCWDNNFATPLHQLRVCPGHSQSDSGQTRGEQEVLEQEILEQDDQGAVLTGETANLITWGPILLPTVQ